MATTAPARSIHPTPPAAPDGVAPPPGGTGRAPLAWHPVLLVVAAKVAVDLATSGRYGWHRDELYYADAGRHLALGFVDFPPVTPLLAALARVLFGDSLVGLRLVASAAGAAVVVVTAALCRDLGGSRRAQVLAAVAIAPLLAGSNAMFQTVSFDQLTWALVLWATARLLQDPTDRRWLALAAAAGLAWETKYTVATLFAGLAVGFLATRSGRATLRRRPVVVGVGVVGAVAAPNLWWQATHGWASVAFLTGRSGTVRSEYPPSMFLAELVVMVGVASVPLALVGIVHLWRDARQRPLGVALATVAPLSLVLGGKGYYAAPLAIGALAAGAVALDGRAGGWARYRRALPYVVVIGATACSPMIVPVLPRSLATSSGVVAARDDYANQLGWPELVDDTARAWRALPPAQRLDTTVLAGNYGVAGALVRFGPARGIDGPVASGHLTWAEWPLPAAARGDRHALAVGFGPGPAPSWCRDARRVGRIRGLADVETEERGWPIWSCRLTVPVDRLRPRLTHP